ncbi:MAG: DUF4864 domain-containing protein [Myxococcota bacterium]
MILPHPSLSPSDIVRFQLTALGDNDTPHPDRGIELVWRFASPSNKATTGPLKRFKRMVKNPVYGLMINHQGFKITEPTLSNGQASVDARLDVPRIGGSVVFRFILSRAAEGDFVGCWMTDSVIPLGMIRPQP